MTGGLLLVVVGIGLIVAMALALRSERVHRRLYRANVGFRSAARREPAEPEAFARRFEMGIYVGMCAGGVIVLLGVLVAAG